ncbi:hypothetical protein SASPL_147048 [Salvia splendens]|uniref:AAA+ ATPase At3g28540-like C-terminal domain-containing protein n=1 Tax=Salvia splendens TaxID=180675 RepID=A0A8X8WF25_SALSN|nr:hypothetical protein SASPL_147048 [Salvia splendens]
MGRGCPEGPSGLHVVVGIAAADPGCIVHYAQLRRSCVTHGSGRIGDDSCERIIVFATNHVEKLDKALIRRGRMDEHIELSYCGFEAFKILAKNYLEVDSHELFAKIRQLLNETEMSPADVADKLMRKSDGEDADGNLMRLIKALEEVQEKNKAAKLEEKEKIREMRVAIKLWKKMATCNRCVCALFGFRFTSSSFFLELETNNGVVIGSGTMVAQAEGDRSVEGDGLAVAAKHRADGPRVGAECKADMPSANQAGRGMERVVPKRRVATLAVGPSRSGVGFEPVVAVEATQAGTHTC